MPANPPSTTVWRDLLLQVLQTPGARGAAVWIIDGPKLNLAAVAGLSAGELVATNESGRQRHQSLAETLTTGEPRAVLLSPGSEDATLVLISPLHDGRTLRGALELALHPQVAPQTDELVRQLGGLCQHIPWDQVEMTAPAAIPIEPPTTPEPTPSAITPPEPIGAPAAAADPALLEWLLHIERSLKLADVAAAAVNDGRLLFEVDRMSLVVRRGGSAKIIAVSGQEHVHPRSNVVRALTDLATLVMQAGQPFRFPLESPELPSAVEEALAEFLQQSGTRFLLIVPLRSPPPPRSPYRKEEAVETAVEAPVIGAIIFEQMAQDQPPAALVSQLDRVLPHLSAAVANARAHESLFLLPVWRVLGHAFDLMRHRRIATAAILLAVIATVAALILVPWDYRVEATGRLMPVVQRDVFAPWDGQVQDLLVHGGERVQAGDVLLKLRNDELQTQLVKVRNEIGEKRKLVSAVHAELSQAEKAADRQEAVRLQGKIAETQIELQGLDEQRKLLEERLNRLTVRAPIDGVVTTFQADQELASRPVTRGDRLLQVMDDRGEWRLELEAQEHRLGHLRHAQQVIRPDLPIEFRLLTQPEHSYFAKLDELATRAEMSEMTGSVVEMRAEVDIAQIPQRAIGAEVRGRIACGQKPLGYVLFGDVIEFIERYLWW